MHTLPPAYTLATELASCPSYLAHRIVSFIALNLTHSRLELCSLKEEIHISCREETADLFANVCTGMFLRVGAVSSECRGHPRGSEFTSYISAIEEVLCYMLKGHWDSVFRGRSGWPRQETFSNRKMIKILMTCEDNAAHLLSTSSFASIFSWAHVYVWVDTWKKKSVLWLVSHLARKEVRAGHMRTSAELKNL